MSTRIQYNISNKILTISPSLKGKGGIATVVNSLSSWYETFNHVPSTRSDNMLIMIPYFVTSILALFYYSIIKKTKIVHIHGASYGSFTRKRILIQIAKFLHLKVVYHMHGGGFEEFYKKSNSRRTIEKTLNEVDIFITLTQEGYNFFSSIIDPSKVIIVNNSIKKNTNYIPIYRNTNKKIEALFLGLISERKGIFDLIEVINKHRDFLANKFVLYVGGNGEVERLKKYIKENKLEDLIKYEGWVSGDKKAKLLELSDIYILPSYNESFGMSNLEAMTYGMPIISTKIGGIPEVVIDNLNGFLIEPGDHTALFEKIHFFINNPNMIEIMGKESLIVATKFYPENIIPKLDHIYKNLLQD